MDDQASIVDIPPIAGLNAQALNSSTDATSAVIPDRTVTASAEVAGLGLAPPGFGGLLSVGVAGATASASCPTAGGTPVLTATSSFANVSVLGIPVNIGDQPVVIDVGLVRASFIPNFEERTATSVRRVALHVEITAIFGGAQLLVADIAEASVSAVDLPCEAPTAGLPPTLTVESDENRVVTAQVTPASGVAHDEVTDCTISVRPAGSTDPFVPVETTFDPATGTCSATLDPATFPPGDYEVQATAVDADGDVGTSEPVIVTVAAPVVTAPTADGRDLRAQVTPAPGVPIASCEFTLTPAVGGDPRTIEGTFDAATGTCSLTLPADVPDGSYDVAVTVVDANGDTATAESAEPLVITGNAPTVALEPDQPNRQILATATPAAGETLVSCTVEVRPAGGGEFVTVESTFDPETGECSATLDPADFPPGDYDVQITVVDSSGDSSQATGTITVAAPAVEAPTADGRELSVAVTPAPGVPIESCQFTLTPAVGGESQTVEGTFDAATGTCSVTLPPDIPDGSYDVTVTVVDANGDTATAESAEPLEITGNAPTVALEPDQPNREILATATPAAGETLVSCTVEVRPAGGGEFVTVESTFDPETGECSATLDPADFPPGDYDVRVTVVDSNGDSTQETGTITVARPSVGDPVLRDGAIEVPITPAPGTPIISCKVTITPVAGGAPVELDGVISDGVCRAPLPSGMAPGDYTITVAVTDASGDTGTGSGRFTVPAPAPSGAPIPGGGGPPPAPSPRPPFAEGTPSELVLACTDRRLVLTEVVKVGRRVRIAGAAEDRYRGRRIALVFLATGKVVARPLVGSDGLLRTTVRAPRARLTKSNRARYMLRAGRDRSLPLKLARRMARVSLTRSEDTVAFGGTVTRPLARERQVVVLRRMVFCGQYETVGRTRLSRTGRYRFQIPAPTDARTAVYRAQTRVPTRPGEPARNGTFTLPQAIELR